MMVNSSGSTTDFFTSRGFEAVKVNQAEAAAFGKLRYGSPTITGPCEPTATHRLFAESVTWREGPVVLSDLALSQFISLQAFCCLASGEVPFDLLSLRDYFDYGLEVELQKSFEGVRPMVGPGWQYLYTCENLKKQLGDSMIYLSYPIICNSLTARSTDPALLLESGEEMRRQFEATVPLPTIWGYPVDLPLGSTDNIFDSCTERWYTANLQGKFEGTISLSSFIGIAAEELEMAQHTFQGTIRNVRVRRKTLTLHISDLNGHFQRQKKLSRLSLVFA